MTHTQAIQSAASERYLLDEMSEVERHAFEEHYFDCAECAEDVRAGGLLREGVEAGLLPQMRSRVVVPFPPRRFTRATAILPWAVAATLALALGYQQLTLPARALLQPQALAAVTLRPESRGAEPAIPLRPGTDVITLAPDVMLESAAELAYELRAADNRIVASGQTPSPAPGAPLLLLIPAWTLKPSEHYILDVRHGGTRDLLGTFRFVVTE
jgi:hypothetical protein